MRHFVKIITISLVGCAPATDEVPPDTGPAITKPSERAPLRNEVELHRDEHGLAHIVADSTEAALYAVGRATAQDRLFQMDLNRKWTEGRLSELYWQTDGSDASETLNAKMLKHDRSMRVWGFARHNDALIPKLPIRDQRRLKAYAAGVNSVLTSPLFELPPAYKDLGITEVDPWTAADALDVWDRMSHLFAKNNIHHEITNLLDCHDADGCVPECVPPIDDSGAIIPPQADSSARRIGPQPLKGGFMERTVSFKASHGWVISAERSTTGSPILGLDPKIAVTAPSTLYPAHWVTPEHNVWSLAFVGTPAPVLFWNEHLGQSVTAYGGDITDLFELEMVDSETYRVDGEVFNLEPRVEVIRTTDPNVNEQLIVQESIFGPVANELLAEAPIDRIFAVRHLERDRLDTTHSALAALDAATSRSHAGYQRAMDRWLTPGVHAMFGGIDAGTGESHIAYYMAGGVPWRTPKYVDGMEMTGRIPYDGSTRREDWNGRLSITEKPHVVDPEQGYIFAANNLAIGSDYDTVSYVGYPDIGDTFRSYTLRKHFEEALRTPEDQLSLRDVHAIHYNARPSQLAVLADILDALQTRGDLGPVIELDDIATKPKQRAQKVLGALRAWQAEKGLMDQSSQYFPLLSNLNAGPSGLTTRSRKAFHPEQACTWNEAEGGVIHFFKAFVANGDRVLDDVSTAFILDVANRAWTKTLSENAELTPNPLDWPDRQPAIVDIAYQTHLGLGKAYANLHNSPNLTAELDQMNGALINSTRSSTAPATIHFGDHRDDVGVFPPGISENPEDASFDAMLGILEAVSDGDQSAMPHLSHSVVQINGKSVSLETLLFPI